MHKESYQQKLQAQFDKWKAEIDKLKMKVDQAEVDAQFEYYEQIEDLRMKQAEANEKLAELLSSEDEAWEELKAGAENAWLALGEAVQRASSIFK